MPRVAWVAIGAALGALVGEQDAAAGALIALALLAIGLGLELRSSSASKCGHIPRREHPDGVLANGMGRGARILLASLGIGLILGRIALTGPPAAPSSALPTGSGPWEALVESVGSPRQGQQAATIVLDGTAASPPGSATAAGPGSAAPAAPAQAPIRIAATLPRYPSIAPGDRIQLRGSLRAPSDDDYGSSLRARGLAGTIRSPEMRVLPSAAGAGRLIEGIRRTAGDALARVLPEPEAGLAAGILIGLRDRVDREVAAAFTTAGVSHVVAISGWNIAIVGAVVGAVLGGWPRRRRALATAVVVAVYTVLAGASASVVRAALMAGVVLIARESGRAGRAATALAWAVLLMLFIDPAIVADAGFSLSVLATAGLLAWGSGLTVWFGAIGRGAVPRWIAENLGVSLAAQAWTLPVVLASFGRLALIAPLVNLAVVPLVAPTMAAGAMALVGGLIAMAGIPMLGTVLALPAWILLGTMIRLVELGAALPFASVNLEPPADAAAAVLAGSVLLAAILLRRRLVHALVPRGRPMSPPIPGKSGPGPRARGRGARQAGLALLAITAIAIPLAGTTRLGGGVHVVVLDVGQGDAILVEGNAGSRMLIDGGPDPDRLLGLLDRRYAPWDRRLDLVVLTHPHEDHVAGLPTVLRRYRVIRVAEPGMPGTGPGYAEWRTVVGEASIPLGYLSTGDALRLDDLVLHVLWPDADHVPAGPSDDGTVVNASSIVLLGEVGGRRVLLQGDAEGGIDPYLLARGLPAVDLLKVAHHGSATSSSQPLLDRLRPGVAIISVGAGNTYGHPGRATLSRLASIGARVLRTDRNGTVDVRLGPAGVSVFAGRQDTATPAMDRVLAAVGRGGGRQFEVPPDRPDGGLAPARLLYHRVNGRSNARRGRVAAALARAAAVAPPPLAGRRRGRSLPRRPHRRAERFGPRAVLERPPP